MVMTALKLTTVLLSLILYSSCDNILLILDKIHFKQTHSKLIAHLQSSHNLQITYSVGKSKIQLKTYDRFKYDHVIVMCLSTRELSSQIKASQIVSYFDEGGNVVIIGDIDTEKSFRKLFQAFGIELDQYGSKLKDHFSNHKQVDILKTHSYVGAPFLSVSKPLLYRGTGLNLVNYVNYQLYELVSSESTTLTRNYFTEETSKMGRTGLVVGVQGLNNARALLLGSQYFLSNEAMEMKEFDNQKAVWEMLEWTFCKRGIVRATNMKYYGEGAKDKESLFNVGEKIRFQVEVEIQKGGHWEPYTSDDLMVEFVMLDPWVRVPLIQINSTALYSAQFYAPAKQGIYQFKIIYRKPGYNFLSENQRVTVRPYKHDEYQRFLLVAYPYQFGLIATVVGTFIFIVIYLYTKTGTQKAKEE